MAGTETFSPWKTSLLFCSASASARGGGKEARREGEGEGGGRSRGEGRGNDEEKKARRRLSACLLVLLGVAAAAAPRGALPLPPCARADTESMLARGGLDCEKRRGLRTGGVSRKKRSEFFSFRLKSQRWKLREFLFRRAFIKVKSAAPSKACFSYFARCSSCRLTRSWPSVPRWPSTASSSAGEGRFCSW